MGGRRVEVPVSVLTSNGRGLVYAVVDDGAVYENRVRRHKSQPLPTRIATVTVASVAIQVALTGTASGVTAVARATR